MKSIKMYVSLIRYINPRWFLTSLAFGMTLLCIILNLFQPYIISQFIDQVLISKDVSRIFPLLSLSFVMSIFAFVCRVIGFSIFRFLEARHTLDMRNTVLRHIRKIPLTEIEKNGAGKYMALLGMDSTTTAKFINVIAIELCSLWLQMIVSLIIIFSMDWRMGVVATLCIPIVVWIPRVFDKSIRSAVGSLRAHNEDIGTSLYESIQGSREIRTYGLEHWEEERNEMMYKELVKVSIKEGLFRQLSGQTGFLIVALAIVLIYGFGSGQVISGLFTVGMLVASVQYINSVLSPIQSMNYLISDLLGSEVAMKRIEDFLKSPVEALAKGEGTVDGLRKLCVTDINEGAEREPIIACRDLFVSYDQIPILKGINLEVQKGQIVAIVGRSGSGKSTLFKTLQGFMEVDSGELSISHIPFKYLSRKAIASQMSYVSQETFLFKGTLYENVSLGKLDATEQEVYQALCEVDLQSFVDALPEGIHTKMDNQGFQLSGGQRQRLAIARAIIKKPDILILDEPTSSLDRSTEEQVIGTINEIMRDKTTLISTHRLESIRFADLIYVLDQGMVLDSGTHEELMRRCHIYRNMVKSQELQEQIEQVV